MKRLWIALTAMIVSLASTSVFAVSEQSCSMAVLSIDEAIRSLSALRLKLDIAKAEGSSSIAMTALSSDYRTKENAFIQHIELLGIMSRETLIERMKQEIKILQKENLAAGIEAQHLHEQFESAVIDGRDAAFHPIEPGSFLMGDLDKKDVTLTKPFEMMATLTTQVIWRKIAELANAKLGYRINPTPSHFVGETHPVERVSYNDIQIWLRALNELSESGETALTDLIRGHKIGDVYRLPTEAEWEFVVRGRGLYNKNFHFAIFQRIEDYAWSFENSENETQSVAEKRPLVIDGREFYDMHGNVSEWVSDRWDETLPGGNDPHNLAEDEDDDRVVRGGSWQDDYYESRSGRRDFQRPSLRNNHTGFRFVRTVKESAP